MSVEETQQVLREYFTALLGGGDFGSFFADDVRWTTMETGDVISGRDAVRDFIGALHAQLFDASPELGALICGDSSAALEATFVGRHIAEFAGVAATGAQVRLPYAVFYELEGGKISELRAYFPITAMIEQLKSQTVLPAR
jgi:predicted ester cyclase